MFILFTILNSTQAQDSISVVKPQSGKEAVKSLSEGTLIVRLCKYEYITESTIAFQGEEQGQVEKLRIQEANKALIQEFKKEYNFSDLVFAYEADLYHYLEDPSINVFLDDELKVDPAINIKEGPLFILATIRSKSFRLYNKNFQLIEDPSFLYVNKHIDRKYQFFLAKLVLSFSNIFSSKKTAADLNKDLNFYAKKNP